jgi:hypothetical protein
VKPEKGTEGRGGPTNREDPKRESNPAPPDRLQNFVEKFCNELRARFAPRVEGNSKGFRRRVLVLIAKRLPPFRKSPGRPRLRYVTLAVNAYEIQLEEIKAGRRKNIDWRRIAIDCDPTFAAIRSNYKRQTVLKRLRDAVHARLKIALKNAHANPSPIRPSR